MPLALLVGFVLHSGTLQSTSPDAHDLKTRWSAQVSAVSPHPEYPRPQMVRSNWMNLNGKWAFAFAAPDAPTVDANREILVPFPPESQLSGIHEMTPEGQALYYRRTFKRPDLKPGERLILHFGASDWDTQVSVNGKVVGRHLGGYDPFSFDITGALAATGPDSIEVRVIDPTDAGPQPRGKQVRKPGGIFYTPTSGIWQTVWLERVPSTYIGNLKIWNKVDGRVFVQVQTVGNGKMPDVWAEIYDGNKLLSRSTIKAAMAQPLTTVQLTVPQPKLWSPASPKLYRIKVGLKGKGMSDEVESYTGIREIHLGKDRQGRPQVTLNGKPIFMFGPLDQGFWPDGLYTAPTDDALKYDIEMTKKLGFNMIRKHVKVEPDRWYYWCDRLGLVVMQDMPSGDASIGPKDPDIVRTPQSAEIYRNELKAMIGSFYNHPSIVCWVPFNEGWGQFETAKITDEIRVLDPTRLIDSTTGWADRGVGDFSDVHVYPGPGVPTTRDRRASMLGEFGGLGLVVPGHMWQKEGWGYQSYQSPEELTQAMEGLLFNVRLMRGQSALSGAVYTQTTDVETEANGLMTYDRELVKADLGRLKAAISAVYRNLPASSEVVPTSEKVPQQWHYVFADPGPEWANVGIDDSKWSLGVGGFGTVGTPGAVIKNEWNTPDIWLRRTIKIPATIPANELYLRVHHDEDMEVYLDGKPLFSAKGFLSSYNLVPWPGGPLTAGKHTLAVHCHQTSGGQFVDVGIVRAKAK